MDYVNYLMINLKCFCFIVVFATFLPLHRHTEKLPDDFALLLFLHASAIVQDQPKNKVYSKSEVIDLLQ